MKIPNAFQKMGFSPETFLISSKLKPEELMSRLEASSEQDRWDSFFVKPGTFLMYRSSRKFRLRTKPVGRNSFQTFCYAKVLPEGKGSKIEGKFLFATSARITLSVFIFGAPICAMMSANGDLPGSLLWSTFVITVALTSDWREKEKASILFAYVRRCAKGYSKRKS
jgi:hypothetical protein